MVGNVLNGKEGKGRGSLVLTRIREGREKKGSIFAIALINIIPFKLKRFGEKTELHIPLPFLYFQWSTILY